MKRISFLNYVVREIGKQAIYNFWVIILFGTVFYLTFCNFLPIEDLSIIVKTIFSLLISGFVSFMAYMFYSQVLKDIFDDVKKDLEVGYKKYCSEVENYEEKILKEAAEIVESRKRK